MSCCGKVRTGMQPTRTTGGTKIPRMPGPVGSAAIRPVPTAPGTRATALPGLAHKNSRQAAAQSATGQTAYFSYLGQTGITVTGPYSGRAYRFTANSAPVAVDARDAAALARVPNLRMVRKA